MWNILEILRLEFSATKSVFWQVCLPYCFTPIVLCTGVLITPPGKPAAGGLVMWEEKGEQYYTTSVMLHAQFLNTLRRVFTLTVAVVMRGATRFIAPQHVKVVLPSASLCNLFFVKCWTLDVSICLFPPIGNQLYLLWKHPPASAMPGVLSGLLLIQRRPRSKARQVKGKTHVSNAVGRQPLRCHFFTTALQEVNFIYYFV